MKRSLAVAVLIVVSLPLWLEDYYQHIMILVCLFGYLGICWNILGGLAGQLSLGASLFFGAGAYTYSILHYREALPFGMSVGLAVLLVLILAIAIGIPTFRFGLSGVQFSMATIAFAEMARILVLHEPFLGAAEGFSLPFQSVYPSKLEYCYIIIALLVSAAVAFWWLEGRNAGLALKLVREHEATAEATGINARASKLAALCMSAAGIAIGGIFYAEYFLYLHPDSEFGFDVSVRIAAASIFGGRVSVLGPVIGSAILTPLAEGSRALVGVGGRGVHQIIHGLALIVACVFFPSGIVDGIRRVISEGLRRYHGRDA
ncbi:MAG TPA: branched-chain amino acid ABC transporter permease [Thermoanaerobaculia bacterium]|jgi:branched-chain amino acid transport system permease protein|nr:branched-chain amino acid ABC transporter permease [Thermoanaerobaculia bacterium]